MLDTFQHEALFYRGEREFLAYTGPFIREGVDAGEAVLVLVPGNKVALLRDELGEVSDAVRFDDMERVGHNPALIIDVWNQFVAEHTTDGRGVRGIGEPIWASRSPAALTECQLHESLINVAFADASRCRILCPYDTETLPESVVAEAMRSHPVIAERGAYRESSSYAQGNRPFDAPLPEPKGVETEIDFDRTSLRTVRMRVAEYAATLGFDSERVAETALAASEVATNSIRYGGGRGTLRVWYTADELICEVSDAGRLQDPLVGRLRPDTKTTGGFGLWLVNHFCDLVQIRSTAAGTTVRLRIARPHP